MCTGHPLLILSHSRVQPWPASFSPQTSPNESSSVSAHSTAHMGQWQDVTSIITGLEAPTAIPVWVPRTGICLHLMVTQMDLGEMERGCGFWAICLKGTWKGPGSAAQSFPLLVQVEGKDMELSNLRQAKKDKLPSLMSDGILNILAIKHYWRAAMTS